MPSAPSDQIMFYPHGVVAPERREYRDLSQVDNLSLDACNDALDDLCASILSPPPGQFGSVRLWANASAYEPVQLAEKAIQGYVRTMLLGRYPGLIPVEEQITDAGRLDVGIVSPRRTAPGYIGVLELKVLRSSSNESQLTEGIKQAASYQSHVESDWAQVCCFDMRPYTAPQLPTENNVQHATRRSVSIRHWRLEPTAQAVRDREDEGSSV